MVPVALEQPGELLSPPLEFSHWDVFLRRAFDAPATRFRRVDSDLHCLRVENVVNTML